MINAKTELFAVLGHPIGHSLSPAMHNAAYAELGMDALYLAFDVPPRRLMAMLDSMAELGFRGANLTVPLKEEAYRSIGNLSEQAAVFKSVNTVRLSKANLEGHSTDGDGFLCGVKESLGISLKGSSVFVLGCGGAGRAVALASGRAGADRVLLSDQDAERAERLAAEMKSLSMRASSVSPDQKAWAVASRESDLVVQATPIGMNKNDEPLLDAGAFRAGQYLYDLIYMFPETELMRRASDAGARTANGLEMLLYQGALSFEYWTEREPPIEAMRSMLTRSVYGEKT